MVGMEQVPTSSQPEQMSYMVVADLEKMIQHLVLLNLVATRIYQAAVQFLQVAQMTTEWFKN